MNCVVSSKSCLETQHFHQRRDMVTMEGSEKAVWSNDLVCDVGMRHRVDVVFSKAEDIPGESDNQ